MVEKCTVDPKTSSEFKIAYLADYPDCMPTLGQWFYREWGWFRPDFSENDFTERMRSHLNRDRLPIALIAFIGSTLVGSASLRVCDMDTRKELTPWLASVYVPPDFRGRGVGSRLEEAVAQKAGEMGYMTIFLYTFDKEEFYARLGWTVKERTLYRNHRVIIMEKGLATNSSDDSDSTR